MPNTITPTAKGVDLRFLIRQLLACREQDHHPTRYEEIRVLEVA